jgi:16S rRNA (cytosine967-C5)-methyltransferase
MKPGARIKAAVEILEDIIVRHRPVALALAEWAKSHRFAGSGDRNAIGGLVYDAMRRRASIAWSMRADTPRALAIGAASTALGLDLKSVADACDGSEWSPESLNETELDGLTRGLSSAPAHIQADVPEWLWPAFERVFGDRAVAEGQAMARRAPADLRVNTLKATREKVMKALASFGPVETALSPIGVRIAPPVGTARTPNLTAEAAFQAGWFEIQDEGSQVAALLSGAGPRLQVLDLCAGGGGKTLAMAARMQNSGQIYAYDEDRMRLKPIFERVKRAGVRNVQILRAGDRNALQSLGPRFDVVLIDAPCTGTGTWRRRPDAKWRLKPESLEGRIADQRAVLDMGADLVRPGGRLVYVTCSILPAENADQIEAFLARVPRFSKIAWRDVWREKIGTEPPQSAGQDHHSLILSPGLHGTDGFFISILGTA